MDYASETSFFCEINGLLGLVRWIWKDSLVQKWTESLEDLALLQSLTPHRSIQRPLFTIQSEKLLLIALTPEGRTLQSFLTQINRKRDTSGADTIISNDKKWMEFCLYVFASLITAMELLQSQSYFIGVLTVSLPLPHI